MGCLRHHRGVGEEEVVVYSWRSNPRMWACEHQASAQVPGGGLRSGSGFARVRL